jgi:hypothetical protein
MNVRRSTVSTRQALSYLHDTRRSRVTALRHDLPPRLPLPASSPELGLFESRPLCVRVADRLSDAIFAIFEALEMCEGEQAALRDAERLGAQIRVAYDQVNGLMKTIAD